MVVVACCCHVRSALNSSKMASLSCKIGNRNTFLVIFFSIVIRLLLFLTPFNEWLPKRVELTTPLTSIFRLKECISRIEYGISPYQGDICHQPPLMILFFQILKVAPEWILPVFFIVCDVFSACLLMSVAKRFVEKELKRQTIQPHHPEAKSLLWIETDISYIPFLVVLIYLLNPYTIATCVALSTCTLNNLIISFSLFFLLKGNKCLAAAVLAIATYLSLYPVMLIVPICIEIDVSKEDILARFTTKSVHVLAVFLFTLFGLFGISYSMFSSWDFLDATYMFILNVPDLTPNMGLFWYFFLEMFEHFRLFFLCVLQIHAFVYLIPFSIIFRNRPTFLCYILLSTISWSKSYQELGDWAIPFALLPLWRHAYTYLRSLFVIMIALIFSTIMAPALFYLWIYVGRGNANFFYASTLAFNLAQIMLITDVIYAYLRREYHLKHGLEPLTEEGDKGYLVMK